MLTLEATSDTPAHIEEIEQTLSHMEQAIQNTIRRVEVGAPIYDKDIKSRILSMFRIMMQDNVKARIQQPDGSYKKVQSNASPLNAQEYFYAQAYASAKAIATAETEVEAEK